MLLEEPREEEPEDVVGKYHRNGGNLRQKLIGL